MKFDYYKSAARKNYYRQREMSPTIFGLLTFINFGIGLLSVFLILNNDPSIAGLGQIILAAALLLQSFYLSKRYAKKRLSKDNVADKFSEELVELFETVLSEAERENTSHITPEYVFSKYTLTNAGKVLFSRLSLPFIQKSKNNPARISPVFSDQLLQEINSLANETFIEIEDLLIAIVNNSNLIQNFLGKYKLNKADLIKISLWRKNIKARFAKTKFWEDQTVMAGVGENWSYGYTPTLARFSYDLSQYFQNPRIKVDLFSRQNKLEEIETVLAKSGKNNVLLVGENGVGKKTFVNAMAAKLAQGNCLAPLKYKKIISLNVGELLAGGSKADIVARINACLYEAVNAGNIIVFIDNFQSLLGNAKGGEEVGGVDATQALLPFLERAGLRVIASVTPDDYFSRVRTNGALSGLFEKIDIEPTNQDDTLSILLEEVGLLEYKYRVFIPVQTLKEVIRLSDRYVHEVPFPEKALRLIEEASVNFSSSEVKVVLPKDIEALVSRRTNVPVGEADQGEKTKLLNLEKFLHERVIGQEEAISAIADALRRVRAGLTTGKRPVGVFLFLGPTGVGKTETAKALAENYFGSEKNMIRLDMSEYQQQNSVDRLIGSASNPNGVLTDAITANPFSLILLDEIEKADRNVLNVFLQVFEDGRLTDARGKVSDFTNAIIIATSNAGAEFIREQIGEGKKDIKDELVNKLQKEGKFTPEFLNRFDGVIVFKPLTQEQLGLVANLMINGINEALKEKKISVTVQPDALSELIKLGYDPQFGARPMRRVIQQKVENLLAKKMLSGEVDEGQILSISLSDL